MNPAELAQKYAKELMELHFERDVNNEDFEVDRFTTLSDIATILELTDRPYIVKAQSAITFPERHEPLQFSEVTFMGEFSGYDIVTPPRSLGRTAIGGLYLTFGHVIMLSDAELPEAPVHVTPFSAEVDRIAA